MVSLAPAYQMALYDLCRRWFGEEGNGLAGRLLAGLGNNEAADAGLELVGLGRAARKDARIEAALLEGRSLGELRAKIEGFDEGREFIERFESFLRDHGHHCRGEIELLNARWSEEPERVLDLLRGLLRASGEGDLLDRHGRIAADRREALAKCRKLLRNPLWRIIFEFVRRKAERCTPLRENLKSIAVRWIAASRKALLELGSRLAGRGILGSAGDVFFLRIEEVADALRSPAGGPGPAAAAVASRRAEYERNRTLTPPTVVAGRFEPSEPIPEPPAPSASVLTGLAVHPGLVAGRARVILREGDGEVLPGEILVAPFTDPGWTPYLLNAAAVVVDMGGLLSHGSIIAREYGIPTVVNVGPATRLIRTGQMLEVDAGRGIVRILE
jgi:pyruvate,water dikinase